MSVLRKPPIGAVITAAAQHGIVDVVSREPNLEDVFLAQYGDHPVDVADVDAAPR